MMLLKNHKLLTVLYFVVLIAVILIPMLTQNDIITTIKDGSDMQAHLNVIKDIHDGNKIYPIYFGQVIFGYLLSPFGDSPHLESIYLWVNFIVLIGMVFTIYYIVRKLFGNMSAYLVIPMIIFGSTGIISLFRYGTLFALINMYIILPFAIYFLVRYLDSSKVKYLISSIFLFILFSVFHSTSVYLFASMGLFAVGMMIYYLVKKSFKRMGVVLGIFVFSLAIVMLLSSLFSHNSVASLLSSSNILSSDKYYIGFDPAYDSTMMIRHLSVTIAFILLVSLVLLAKFKYYEQLDKKQSYFIIIIGCFIVTICGAIAMRITHDIIFINRLMLDATTLITIGTACLTGFVLNQYKNKLLNWAIAIMVIGGSIPLLRMWVGV